MATKESTVEYITDQLVDVKGIAFRKMFGEYALYCGTKVVALICDDTLFVKITDQGHDFVGSNYKSGFAYKGARESMEINADLIDDRQWLCELIKITEENLPDKKEKKIKKK